MSKSEIALILPSEGDGWEVWATTKGQSKHVRSVESTLKKNSGQVGDCVAFSICRVATLPMLLPSGDVNIYRGAAQLELENSGLLHDVENYKGWDCLPIEVRDGKALVTAIYLLEEELNAGNDLRHYSFDFSARFYLPDLAGDCVAMWRERNTWVMAFYRNNIPFFTEPLGNDLSQLAMTVNLLLNQLEVKGIFFHPEQARLWSVSEDQESIAEHFHAVGLKLIAEPRPIPAMPIGSIELQPSAASEWQKQVRSMMRLRVIAVVITMLFLVASALLWWKVAKLDQQIDMLKGEVAQYAPQWEKNTKHLEAWEELTPLVTDRWPLNLYKACVLDIPRGQPIRFNSINVQAGYIQINGSAVSVQACNQYKPMLRKSEEFDDLTWEMGQETLDQKTTRWNFQYDAKMEVAY